MKPAPVKRDISFEHFQQLDIRVGTISSVEDIAESRKLVKLTVNFGDHSRSILVGMKQERSDPSEIEGMQALFVLNLPEKRAFTWVFFRWMVFPLTLKMNMFRLLAQTTSNISGNGGHSMGFQI